MSSKKRQLQPPPSLNDGSLYTLTFAERNRKLSINVKFIRSIRYTPVEDIPDEDDLPGDNSDIDQDDYALLWFTVNQPSKSYDSLGFFVINSIEQIENLSVDAPYNQISFLQNNTISDTSYTKGINLEEQPMPSLKEYIDPSHHPHIWIGLGIDGLTDAYIKPYNITTVDSTFVDKFPDYLPFMEFVTGKICGELHDTFCTYYLGKLNPVDFTVNAPKAELNFYNAPAEVLTGPTPFYNAMRFVYKNINTHQPSVNPPSLTQQSEYSYFIKLNRLIYYYNVHNLLNHGHLRGFENTGGVLIYTHGVYRTLDEIIPVPSPLENIFVCSKASVGYYSFGLCENIFTDIERGSFTDELYESIETNGFLTFDKTIFKRNARCMYSDRSNANCFIENQDSGSAMRHYIFPNTNQFINRTYSGNLGKKDHRMYIIDLESLNASKDSGLTAEQRIKNANLLHNPEFQKLVDDGGYGYIYADDNEEGVRTLAAYEITLEAVVNYYSRIRGKENLFIYDKSCGDVANTTAEELPVAVSKIIQHGFGKSRRKRRRRNNTQKNRNARRHTKRKRIMRSQRR